MKRYNIPQWLWWKKYLDTGLSLTNYIKYLIAFFGLASADVKSTMFLGLAYLFFCFFLGMFWIKKELAHQENEINNIINPFQEEVRRKLGKKPRYHNKSR